MVALLAVAGAAGQRPLGGGSTVPALPAWPLFIVVGVGLVASVAIVATALWPPPGRRRGLERVPIVPVRAGPLTVALAFLVPVTIVALLAAPGAQPRHRGAPTLPAIPQVRPGTGHPAATGGRGGADDAAALAAGIAAGLVALALIIAAGRRGRARGSPDHARLAVAVGANEALAALAIPSDPRAAVLVAYARMEAALGAAGLRRRSSEAPREYLSRIAERLGVASEPPARLTRLFERARFSTHPVDESMRREAVSALERIADDLRADGA